MNAMQEATEGHDAPGAADLPGQTIHAAQPGMQMRMRDPRSKSPALAAILSMMPGLGQVYIGYYQRGFVHILVIASSHHKPVKWSVERHQFQRNRFVS